MRLSRGRAAPTDTCRFSSTPGACGEAQLWLRGAVQPLHNNGSRTRETPCPAETNHEKATFPQVYSLIFQHLRPGGRRFNRRRGGATRHAVTIPVRRVGATPRAHEIRSTCKITSFLAGPLPARLRVREIHRLQSRSPGPRTQQVPGGPRVGASASLVLVPRLHGAVSTASVAPLQTV
jgi:hypothetical protein